MNNEINNQNKTTNLNKSALPTFEQNQQKSLEAKKLSVEKIPVKKPFGANSSSKAGKSRTASVERNDKIKLTKNKVKENLNNSMVVSGNKSAINREDKNNLDIGTKSNIPKDFNKKDKEKEKEKAAGENKQSQGKDACKLVSQVRGQGGLFINLMGDGYLE